ncbi:MAG TPA: hypothetical protein VFU31_15915 [Candidatus Binatia bacterium]|nr:hypothetical protein [Candidatus Binatia bacterium]
MKTAAGIFTSMQDAERAVEKLGVAGFRESDIVLLVPGSPQQQLASVPTEEAEQPGMGKAIGSVVGGAVGLAAGAAMATLFLPGVGPVIAVGLGAGGLGVGGALAGAASGDALENLLVRGLPKDEIFLYEDALRQGRAVVIVLCPDDEHVDQSRNIMATAGAESIDAARENWWIGLRDVEAAQYAAPATFEKDEQLYRSGFEAALHPEFRGKSPDETADALQRRFPKLCNEEPFRRGYLRGQSYASSFRDNQKPWAAKR